MVFKQKVKRILPTAEHITELIVAIILLLQGVISISPHYSIPYQNGILNFVNSPYTEIIFGTIEIVTGSAIIIGLYFMKCPYSYRFRRYGTFSGFALFLFLSILAIEAGDISPLFWTTTLGLSLICASLHLHLACGREHGDR